MEFSFVDNLLYVVTVLLLRITLVYLIRQNVEEFLFVGQIVWSQPTVKFLVHGEFLHSVTAESLATNFLFGGRDPLGFSKSSHQF